MALKAIYDKKEDIPEGLEDHYVEKKGKWEVQVEGMKTQADIDRIKAGLDKEKDEHKATKEKLKAYDGLDPEEVRTQLDEIEELRARAEAVGDKFPEDKLNQLVEARVRKEVAPVQRKLADAVKENDALKVERDGLGSQIKMGKIEAAVRKAAEAAKVVPTAIDDIVALAERTFEVDGEGTVVTRDGGIGVDVYLTDMKDKRPHWWPASVGGGASGSDGTGPGATNPWSAKGWNITAQGQVVKEKGRTVADQMAKQAGVFVGATGPAKK